MSILQMFLPQGESGSLWKMMDLFHDSVLVTFPIAETKQPISSNKGKNGWSWLIVSSWGRDGSRPLRQMVTLRQQSGIEKHLPMLSSLSPSVQSWSPACGMVPPILNVDLTTSVSIKMLVKIQRWARNGCSRGQELAQDNQPLDCNILISRLACNPSQPATLGRHSFFLEVQFTPVRNVFTCRQQNHLKIPEK